ncbi:MAG: phage major capsid protein [Bermanella sp.]
MDKQTLSKFQQHIRDNNGLEPQELRAEIESVDEEARTATFSFSSEYEGQRWWGVEILDHQPASVRMERINAGGAFLMDHDRWDQRGVVEKAWLENGRGYCTVRLSQNPKGEELWVDIKDKIRTQVSVRYAIHEAVLEKKVGDMEYYRVTDWEPMEISSVSIAFDPTVGVGRSQEKNTYHPVNLRGAPAMDPKELETDLNQGQRSESPAASKPAPVAAARAAVVPEEAPDQVDAAREIAQIAAQYGANELGLRAIAAGDSVDQFKTKLLDAHQERAAAPDAQSTAADIGLTTKQRNEYSVLNVVRALSTGNVEKYAPFEAEVSRAIAEKRDTEVRGLLVPYDVLGAGIRQQEVVTAGLGGNLVANELHSEHFIEALRQVSMMGQLGVRTLTGLVGNFDAPKQTGTSTFYWVGEDGEPTDSDLDFGLVSMTPRTVAGAVPITRRLMVQTSGEIENMVRSDLLMGLAEALDNDVLATILATAGIGAQAFATPGAPTWSEIVGLETDVDEANALRGNPAYLMRPSMKGNLKSTVKASGTAEYIWANNQVNGTRAASSTQMAAAKILFGDFSQAMIGLWGAVDLTVDKSTKAKSGGSVLRIFQDADTAVRHAGAFSLGQ